MLFPFCLFEGVFYSEFGFCYFLIFSIPTEKRSRLRLDAVVVLSERPGHSGQLLIGYSSGLCLLYDTQGDRVLAILPCQYDLESAAWCGGSGLPVRGAASNPTAAPPHLGTRLLTAYGNGSLGVWQIPLFATGPGLASELNAQALQMTESPSMPYGTKILAFNLCNFDFFSDVFILLFRTFSMQVDQ